MYGHLNPLSVIQIKRSICHSYGVGLVVRRYGCYANGLVFGLTLTLTTLLFLFTLFRLTCYLYRLVLGYH